MMENCRDNAKYLKEGIEKTGKFEVVSKDIGVPLVAFSLKDSSKYTVFGIAESLRRFGWIVPAYTMPPNAEHIAVLRVVIREDFSRSLAERLVSDIQRVVQEMDAHPINIVPLESSMTQGDKGGVKKDLVGTQREIAQHWKSLAHGSKRKTNGIC